jgi:hypothetical protein
MTKELVPYETIERRIYLIRGQKVMIDHDLASLYGVPTKVINQAVRRNIRRFPDDFMFQLTPEEALALRSHFVTSNLRCQFGTSKRGGRRYLPYVFIEHGILMLSSVLNSERAIQVNIQIMRTFTKLRRLLASHRELKRKIEEMEKKYDGQFKAVFDAINELMEVPDRTVRNIGFLRGS